MSNAICGYVTYVTYILRLEEDRWYVGRTQYLSRRLKEHWDGNGAKWTKIFKPVEVFAVFPGDREQEKTEELLMQHGYRHVRGGDYCCEKDLTPKQARKRVRRIKQRTGLEFLHPVQLAELFESNEVVCLTAARRRRKKRNHKKITQ
jgi:predicted GIY-YIG superfamily endonuclease